MYVYLDSKDFIILEWKAVNNFEQNFCQQDVVKTLDELDFSDEAVAISEMSFSRFDSLTMADLFRLSSRHVLEGIAKRQSFKVDVKQYLISLELNKLKTLPSPTHLARNYYIFHQVLINFQETKGTPTFLKGTPTTLKDTIKNSGVHNPTPTQLK